NYIETFLKAIIIGCFISSINISFAQTNTDSLKKELFSDSILKVYEKERIADSLKRTELEKQLAQLKSTDNLAKQELQAELQALKSKKEEDLLKQKNKNDSLKVFTVGFLVSPYIDTIFFIFIRLGSFTPKERAVAIQNKIKQIGQKRNFNPDSLIVSPHE